MELTTYSIPFDPSCYAVDTMYTTSYPEIPLIMTVEEAAKVLQIGRNAMYRLVKTGEVKAMRPGRIRISRDALIAYIRSTAA